MLKYDTAVCDDFLESRLW